MIPPDTIQTIFDTAHVEDVVGEFVSLKKRGGNFVGLCPFHNEKTPSFYVSPAKGIFKCFGCGKAGNAVNFVMEHEHYTYPEALRYLAKKYNIEIEEEEQTPEQQQALNEKESLYLVTAYAQKFFTSQLFETTEGKAIGLSYFHERGFLDKTVEKFQLGYSTGEWDAFTNEALKNAYQIQHLVKTGLSIEKEDKHYDRFRQRVMFPIHNLTGRIIGFGGRILTEDKTKSKYINSPESDIYSKSKTLYGIYFAKNSIISNDNCYLVEGYTDVISLHQAGIENVVASSGTSLTTEQIKLIKRFTQNITILYDGDPAGIKASFRGIDMVLEEGMNVKIVLFTGGDDPDSFVRKHRTVEVKDFIEKNASDFITFKTNLLLEEAANDPIKRTNLIKEIISSVSLIPDGITRSVYVKECAGMLDISEQALMTELNKLLRKQFNKTHQITEREAIPEPASYTAPQQLEVDPYNIEFQEKDLIRLLLQYGNKEIQFEVENEDKQMITIPVKVALFIVNDLKNDDLQFENPEYQKIFEEFAAGSSTGFIPDEHHFITHPDSEISIISVDLISSPYELSKNWERKRISVPTEEEKLKEAVRSSVLGFKSKRVSQLMHDCLKKIKIANDEEEVIALMQRLQVLKSLSQSINGQLGRIVTN